MPTQGTRSPVMVRLACSTDGFVHPVGLLDPGVPFEPPATGLPGFARPDSVPAGSRPSAMPVPATPSALPARRARSKPGALALVLVVLLAAGAGAYLRSDRPSPAAPSTAGTAPNPATVSPTHPAPAAPGSPAIPEAEARRLLGRWVRPDGGYVLEIRKIEPTGSMDVGYFNPAPIRVSRAEGRHDGQSPVVFVELRDANYPGATYTLRHRSAEDRLEGAYYQPLAGQTFEVVFVRE